MLLPPDPNQIVALFSSIDPKKNAPGLLSTLIGPKEVNPNLYRKASNWLKGRNAPSKGAEMELLSEFALNKRLTVEEERLFLDQVNEVREDLPSGQMPIWDAVVGRLLRTPMAEESSETRWCLTEAGRLARLSPELAATAGSDLQRLRENLETLPYAETETVRWVLHRLSATNDVMEALKVSRPLLAITLLYLLAGWEARSHPECDSNFIKLFPERRIGDEIAPPMRRWMECLQSIMAHETQAQTSSLLPVGTSNWDDDSVRRREKDPWSYSTENKRRVLSHQKLQVTITNAKKERPDRAQKLNALLGASPLVLLFENLLIGSELQAQDYDTFDRMMPFRDYSSLYQIGQRAAARERAAAR